jgi:hypothetical protein
MSAHTVTARDLVEGPPVVAMWPTAGRALLMSRGRAYEQARTGELAPGVPVLQVGQRLRVRRADLLRYLGIDDPVCRVDPARAG